jgi:hypothetical protein
LEILLSGKDLMTTIQQLFYVSIAKQAAPVLHDSSMRSICLSRIPSKNALKNIGGMQSVGDHL